MRLRSVPPSWGFAPTLGITGPLVFARPLVFAGPLVLALVCGAVGAVSAQPKQPRKADKPEPAASPAPSKPETKQAKEQYFNFDNLNLNGRSRSPQLLYFLERANEELERASLEKRSFVPHLLRTVEEEAL